MRKAFGRYRRSEHRLTNILVAALVGAMWVSACGDGATDPVPPPPPPPPEPPRATTVTVTPATAELTALGATVQLSARVLDQHGRAIAGAAVSWSTGDAAVATVGTSGLVTAVSNGTATITATSGSVSSGAQVAVAQAVSAVRVSPGSLALLPGDTARLQATALDARDNEVPDIAFEWSSSDAAVATVDGTGLVRAVRVGSATVAAASGDLRDSSRVTVPTDDPSDHHAALTAGLQERPFAGATVGDTEGRTRTIGTLRLDLNPDVFPVIVDQSNMVASVLVAASAMGGQSRRFLRAGLHLVRGPGNASRQRRRRPSLGERGSLGRGKGHGAGQGAGGQPADRRRAGGAGDRGRGSGWPAGLARPRLER